MFVMNTKEFLSLLSDNKDKELIFEYSKGNFVPKAYHITEVKNVYFDSVDCGGNEHTERQTVVQLWTNPIEVKSKYMGSEKALSIMEKVNSVKPLHQDTELFIEYGNAHVPTSTFSVKNAVVEEESITLKLFVQPTACKPALLTELQTVAEDCCGGAKCC